VEANGEPHADAGVSHSGPGIHPDWLDDVDLLLKAREHNAPLRCTRSLQPLVALSELTAANVARAGSTPTNVLMTLASQLRTRSADTVPTREQIADRKRTLSRAESTNTNLDSWGDLKEWAQENAMPSAENGLADIPEDCLMVLPGA
jgi:hypothetical protein